MNYAQDIFEPYKGDPEFLKNIAERNPVSALAQFLYLYELKQTSHPDYEKQLRRTALYFNNPHWLNYQLQLITPAPSKTVEWIAEEGEEEEEPETGATWQEEAENEEASIQSPQDLALMDEESALKEARADEEENRQRVEFTDAQIAEVEELTEEVFAQDLQEADSEDTEKTGQLAESDRPETEKAEGPSEMEKKAAPETDQRPAEGETPALQEAAATDAEVVNETAEETSPAHELDFEPLYTVDYFASQGISIREEDLKDDKLSKQVKSFTAWLKTMKSLHPEKAPRQNEVVEKIIETAAEESNADANILTEAMAEVLLKQNKPQKAIEMYQKLSLMNPAKSTYFAAKIESIKNSPI